MPEVRFMVHGLLLNSQGAKPIPPQLEASRRRYPRLFSLRTRVLIGSMHTLRTHSVQGRKAR